MSQQIISDVVTPLIEEFARSDIRELHLRHGDFELYLSNDATLRAGTVERPSCSALPAPTQASPSSAVEPKPTALAPSSTNLPADAVIITAPNLGTFYRAPKPGAPNYVEIGSEVAVGDDICLIEVMKLFTALRSETAGTVHAILVEDGTMVEAGQALFALLVS